MCCDPTKGVAGVASACGGAGPGAPSGPGRDARPAKHGAGPALCAQCGVGLGDLPSRFYFRHFRLKSGAPAGADGTLPETPPR